jgi:hypothetical protein
MAGVTGKHAWRGGLGGGALGVSSRRVNAHLPVDVGRILRPTIAVEMPAHINKAKLCALLLGLIFLAAQFHFCGDLSAGSNSAHFCPFCATAGSAIATPIPTIGLAQIMVRLEVIPTDPPISAEVALSIAPRAPPSL